MAANHDMLARIFDATTTALARSGARRLSMTDVSAEAGIARGTLYRYFSGKQDLLNAVGVRVVKLFEDGIVNVVEERPELDVRVRVVVEAMADVCRDHPEIMQVIALEPGFSVDFLLLNLSGVRLPAWTSCWRRLFTWPRAVRVLGCDRGPLLVTFLCFGRLGYLCLPLIWATVPG